MIDRKFIGWSAPEYTVEVEKGRLRFFANVIEESNPIYTDEAAAQAAGHPSLLAPLNYSFCLAMERPLSRLMLDEMGIDIGRLLHGEQSFTYHAPIHAGDRITFQCHVTDIFEKKGGKLNFIVRETKATNQDGELVVESWSTLIIRN